MNAHPSISSHSRVTAGLEPAVTSEPLAGGSDVTHGVTRSIRPIWALRLTAGTEVSVQGDERGGGRPTPHTAKAIVAVADGTRATRSLFLADGRLDPREAAALGLLDEAVRQVTLSDLLRRVGDWVRDAGELPGVVDISPYLMRQWAELHPNAAPPDAA